MYNFSNHPYATYYLKFDKGAKFGSAEHYFHFMLGYLLPSLNEILKIESDLYLSNKTKIYYFRSCGPIMDNITNELLSFYTFNYKIMPLATLNADHEKNKILVPRWDKWLIHYSKTNILSWRKNYKFRTDLFSLIDNILSKINNVPLGSSNSNLFSNSYLVLKRSSQPKYYEKDGKAEKPTYGTARRELIGIEEAVQSLRSRNIPIKIFEPGKHTLQEQIIAFSHCRGVIGIRGAEFANLIWMKPKSKVILIRPKNMNTFPPQRSLAKILKLSYFELVTCEGMRPKLNPDLIYKELL